MRSVLWILCVLLLLVPAVAGYAADSQWKLVFRDDFNRADLGSDWVQLRCKASFINGRLHVEGSGPLMVNRHFAPDVRVEWDAEADPTRPPCDLSTTMGANLDSGGAYLYQFGGMDNRWSRISGPDVEAKDEHPKMLIEIGKKYHLVATKEGHQMNYVVNGTKIIEGQCKEDLCGPGFDMVGILTWTGMYVDHVKVYERVTPASDTPHFITKLHGAPLYRDGRILKAKPGVTAPGLDEALADFNSGKLDAALAKFEAMGDSLVSLIGQACVWCDPMHEEKFRGNDFINLAKRFDAAAKAHPEDEILAQYTEAADAMACISLNGEGEGSGQGQEQATQLSFLGPDENPFYPKAQLYNGRFLFWNGREGGDGKMIALGVKYMAELKKTWPENTILQEYTGDQIPWGQELNADTTKHPAWAAYLREAYARQVRTMAGWAVRQSSEGAFGGGWGDDCELMREWMQLAAISSAAEPARQVIEKLADGTWRHVLKNGISSGYGDAEHAREPSMDHLPTMMLIRYGDPMWAERNMASCKTIQDKLMAIDKKGYPRFYSCEWGADGAIRAYQAGGDSAYNASIMKHYVWQAWLRQDPEARDYYVRYIDGWRAATMSASQDKPVGVVPGTIWYPSGEIYPPNGHNWAAEDANYYGYTLTYMWYTSFFNAYYFSHNREFLKPFLMGMNWATHGPLEYSKDKLPSKKWLYNNAYDMPSTFNNKTAEYRWLTGENVYDEYTKRFGIPCQEYAIDHNLDRYSQSFKETAQEMRYNLDMMSKEVLATDRCGIPGALDVFGAYTGAVISLRDENLPTFSVTYDAPDLNLAAVVIESTAKRLRIKMYSFDDTPMKVGIRPWLLDAGKYVMHDGAIVPGEHDFQNRYAWSDDKNVKVVHKGEPIYTTVPPGKEWAVDLYFDEPVQIPSLAPDLAINARDISKTDGAVSVTVHNIGNADAKPFVVLVEAKSADGWKTVAEKTVDALQAPRHFTPSRVNVTIPVSKSAIAGAYRVVVNPGEKQFELCTENNAVEMK